VIDFTFFSFVFFSEAGDETFKPHTITPADFEAFEVALVVVDDPLQADVDAPVENTVRLVVGFQKPSMVEDG
jgi:uncharacterized OB-fold protein